MKELVMEKHPFNPTIARQRMFQGGRELKNTMLLKEVFQGKLDIDDKGWE